MECLATEHEDLIAFLEYVGILDYERHENTEAVYCDLGAFWFFEFGYFFAQVDP